MPEHCEGEQVFLEFQFLPPAFCDEPKTPPLIHQLCPSRDHTGMHWCPFVLGAPLFDAKSARVRVSFNAIAQPMPVAKVLVAFVTMMISPKVLALEANRFLAGCIVVQHAISPLRCR